MRTRISASLSWILLFTLASTCWAQTPRKPDASEKRNQKPASSPAAAPTPTPTPDAETPDQTPGEAVQEGDAVTVETNLVMVPLIVSDHDDRYVTDMRQDEFQVFEDDQPQQVAFFASVTAPFNVILMIDTSASTEDKLGQIQSAAISFVDQLHADDRVKLLSFDDSVHTLSDFTNDRQLLRGAIDRVEPGKGTGLYDAMDFAINSFRRIQGRKAIVIFTDGVDSYSHDATYMRNRRALEEAGIIVYPIRYDTRADVEELARRRQGGAADIGSILNGRGAGTNSRRTTPTTFPGGSGVPTRSPGTGNGGNLPTGTGMPSGGTILNTGIPTMVIPGQGGGGMNLPSRGNYPDDQNRTINGSPGVATSPLGSELDLMYKTADAYLADLATVTGGELNRADTLGSLPAAFAHIAAQLRTQYSLGYYPTHTAHDGKFHKLKIKTSRKAAVIRARPGYRAPLR